MGAGYAAYRPQMGWWDCIAWAKSDIYDFLLFNKFDQILVLE